jgi:hypothetical protein
VALTCNGILRISAVWYCIVFWRTCDNKCLDVYDLLDPFAVENMPGRSTLGPTCKCLTQHHTISVIGTEIKYVGFKVLTAVVMKSSNFWDIILRSTLKIN